MQKKCGKNRNKEQAKQIENSKIVINIIDINLNI